MVSPNPDDPLGVDELVIARRRWDAQIAAAQARWDAMAAEMTGRPLTVPSSVDAPTAAAIDALGLCENREPGIDITDDDGRD